MRLSANIVGSATSSNATLTLVGGVAITNQPVSWDVEPGCVGDVQVGVTGGSLTYQWYFGASPISGVPGSELRAHELAAIGCGGYFSVVVSDPGGSVTSSNATIAGVTLDTTPPLVAVVTPKKGGGTNQANITVTGQAKDKKAPLGSGIVTSVTVIHNAGLGAAGSTNLASILEFGSSASEGKFNFSSPITLIPGTNTVRVYATDLAGNASTNLAAFAFFYAHRTR